VYLRASTEILMRRIALRDRPYERNMERAYIDELNRAYELYFNSPHTGSYHPSVPILMIDTNDLDFVHNLEHLKYVEKQIHLTIKQVPVQSELPLEFAEDSPVKQDSRSE
jgi:deoxyguanosine kinase